MAQYKNEHGDSIENGYPIEDDWMADTTLCKLPLWTCPCLALIWMMLGLVVSYIIVKCWTLYTLTWPNKPSNNTINQIEQLYNNTSSY